MKIGFHAAPTGLDVYGPWLAINMALLTELSPIRARMEAAMEQHARSGAKPAAAKRKRKKAKRTPRP